MQSLSSPFIVLKMFLLFVQFDMHPATTIFPTVVYNLADETPADALVGNVGDSLKPSITDDIAFVLMTSQKFQYFNDFFHLSINGDLTTVRPIDRDNRSEICGPLACCQQMVCQIEATILATINNDPESTAKSNDIHILETKSKKQLTVQILIRINDANDNAPQFLPVTSLSTDTSDMAQPSPFHMYIREEDISSHETLPVAVDMDSRLNGIVEYRLVQSSPFLNAQLEPSLDVSVIKSVSQQPSEQHPTEIDEVHISTPRLIHLRPLDYENVADRELHAILLAVDGGSPQLTGSLSIIVHLLDINDNVPVFVYADRENYVTIPENSTLNNQPLYVAKATDADSGDNGRITYVFSPLTSAEATRKFTIDAVTGAIRVRTALDYETYSERHFVLPIVAKDSGSPQRSASMTIFVKVRDVNDNIPSLIVQENVTVPENELITKPVLKFYIKDEDESSHGKVSCQQANDTLERTEDPDLWVGSQHLRLHGVSETVFFVFTRGVLDYEKTPRASMMIECVDLASVDEGSKEPVLPAHKHLIRITVAVEDRNDNAPSFLKERYFVQLQEHALHGTSVVQVEAKDADSGEYGELVYELGAVTSEVGQLSSSNTYMQAFAIDPHTGIVEVLHPNAIDRELSEVLYVKVFAKDKGGLSASTEIVVELLDINDYAPTFSGPAEVSLEENQRVDTVVAHILFTDKDTGGNGRIHLSIATSGTEVHKYLHLSPDPNFRYTVPQLNHTNNVGFTSDDLIGDGEVRALLVSQMPVDREAYATLFIEIVAYDEGTPTNSATTTITIHILDENDNAPVPTFPLQDTTVGFHPPIYSNSPPGTVVTRVRATDNDQGENGTVVYHIKLGTNGSELFSMNETSGELLTSWIPLNNAQSSSTAHVAQYTQLWQQNGELSKIVRQPLPGTYLVTVVLSDMGVYSHRSETRFFVYINPEDPKLISYSNTNGVWSSHLSTNLKNNNMSMNKLLVILLILLGSFTALSIIVAICWTKMNKNKTTQQMKKSLPAQTEFKPVFTLDPQLRDSSLFGFDEQTQKQWHKPELLEFSQEMQYCDQLPAYVPSILPTFSGSLQTKASNMFGTHFQSNSLTKQASPNVRSTFGEDGLQQRDFCAISRSTPSYGLPNHLFAQFRDDMMSDQSMSLARDGMTRHSPVRISTYDYGMAHVSPLVQDFNAVRPEETPNVVSERFDVSCSYGQYVQTDCRDSVTIFPGFTYPTSRYTENPMFGARFGTVVASQRPGRTDNFEG